MRTTLIVSAMAALAAPALADITVVGSAGAGWKPFPGSLNNYSNASRPFWDQASKDGTNKNIGNYLNATYSGSLPAGSSPSPGITPEWWGAASNSLVGGNSFNGDAQMSFTSSSPIAATLHLEVAGYKDFNEIGWYNVNDPVGAETLHPIFAGTAGPTLSGNFTPSPQWGLYLKSNKNFPAAGQGWFFFSESNRNRANGPTGFSADDKLVQHFALFGANLTPGGQKFYVGVEDLPLSGSGIEKWGDYNDVVMSFTPIPSPGSMALTAIGVLIAARRRR